MSISEYSTRLLSRVVELMPKTPMFLRDTFFQNVNLSDVEYIDVDVVKDGRRKGVYISRTQESQVVDKEGYTTNTFTPPLIALKTPIATSDIMSRLPGEMLYGNQSADSRRQALELKILQDLNNQIDRSEELQAAEALSTGIVNVANGQTVDYGRTATHNVGTLGGSDQWNSGTQDILQDLEDWKNLILKDGLVMPTDIIMSSDIYYLFAKDSKVSALLDNRSAVMGELVNIAEAPGVAYRGYMAGYGKVWTYDNWYKSGGSLTPFIPVKNVIMIARNPYNIRHYGVLATNIIEGNQKRIKFAATNRLADKIHLDDPPVEYIRLQSAPLLGHHNPDSVVTAQVVA